MKLETKSQLISFANQIAERISPIPTNIKVHLEIPTDKFDKLLKEISPGLTLDKKPNVFQWTPSHVTFIIREIDNPWA